MPKKQAISDPKFSYGRLEGNSPDFKFAVFRRRRVIAATQDERPARLLAWALSMAEAMQKCSNVEFIDWCVAWLGELTASGPKGGDQKTKK